MADILQFPQRDADSWSAWERIFRKAAVEAVWPMEMTDAIIERMKSHYERADASFRTVTFELPTLASPDEQIALDRAIVSGIRKLESCVRETVDDILIEIFNLEVALYKAKNN